MKGKVNGAEYYIIPVDTAGGEELTNIRLLTYTNTKIFMLCFSIADRSSFENIQRWCIEIKESIKKPVILLIGTKSDLRNSTPPGQCVSTEEAVAIAMKIHAFDYVECSAFLNDGVKDAFERALIQAISPKQNRCSIG